MGESEKKPTKNNSSKDAFVLGGNELEPRGLGWFIYKKLKQNGDAVLLKEEITGDELTCSEALIKGIRMAIHMAEIGITPNDIISVCSDNNLYCILPMIATFFLGAKLAPMDPMLSIKETRHILNLVEPKIVFCCPEGAKVLKASLKDTDVQTKIVVFDEATEFIPVSIFLQKKENENGYLPLIAKDFNDTACIYFTSGTTGMPKGICISHFSLLYQTKIQATPFSLLTFTRVYWISNILILLCAIGSKGCWVISKFDEKKIFKTLQDFKVDILFLSPIFAYKLTQYPECNIYDTSNLKIVFLAGGIVGEKQIMKIRELFPSALVTSAYGMTESGTAGLIFEPQTDYEMILNKPTSCGKPSKGIVTKIVDIETEEVLGPNKSGEFRMKVITAMNGYYKKPKETEELYDSEGYIKTGDIMYYDEDGCFYVVDRAKDLMKYQSWHIMPAELEDVILEHPSVGEAIVISKPDEVDGDHPMGIVVLKPGLQCTEDDVLQFVNSRVTEYKKLRGGVKIVDKIPVTPSGKYRRRELRIMLQNGLL